MITIRTLTPADAPGLEHVAYETAFFGASAKTFFPDKTLFADLWIRPYLPEPSGFVAETKGKILGYVLGAEQRHYQKRFVRLAPYYCKRFLSNAYPQWRGCLPYVWRVVRYPTKNAPLHLYPAHLHLNVLPEARGQGLGKLLLARYLELLKNNHTNGVQLSTTRENVAAVKLYEQFGFEVWRDYESPLWQPWKGHTVTHVVLVKHLK